MQKNLVRYLSVIAKKNARNPLQSEQETGFLFYALAFLFGGAASKSPSISAAAACADLMLCA